MLLRSVVAAMASSLIFEAMASPIVHSQKKREVPATHRLHERHLPHWENSWTKRSKLPEAHVLPMRIGLKQRSLEAGHDRLMELYVSEDGWSRYNADSHDRSTPGHEDYGKHMTPDEVIDFFAPGKSTVDAVMDWVTKAGISAERVALSVNKQVDFKLPFNTRKRI